MTNDDDAGDRLRKARSPAKNRKAHDYIGNAESVADNDNHPEDQVRIGANKHDAHDKGQWIPPTTRLGIRNEHSSDCTDGPRVDEPDDAQGGLAWHYTKALELGLVPSA